MKNYNYSASLFLGETTRGRSMPVFFDLHTPIINNSPPGCLITGSPGSGKTFLALNLAAMSTILGKTTVIIDPKSDFLNLLSLKEELGRFAVWNMAEGRVGLLDPFYMSNDMAEKLSLVIDTISIFVGGLSAEQLTALAPLVKDIAAGPNPSLQKVVDDLRGRSDKPAARDLGTQLDLIRSMNFARLCFAPGNSKRAEVSLNRGLTVVSLAGLDLPLPGQENATRQNRLATGILFLLTDFLRRLMMNEEGFHPKTLIIDEAHAVVASDAGARTIKNIALLGRSKNMALVLITQNTSHLEKLEIENTISTRFAFQSTRGEAETIISDMELPLGEGFEEIIINLERGECLMKDFTKRFATVKVSSWNKKWVEAFQTNPLEKLRKAKAAQAAGNPGR